MTKVFILVYHDPYDMNEECQFGGCSLPTEIKGISIDDRTKCVAKLEALANVGYDRKDMEILEMESL